MKAGIVELTAPTPVMTDEWVHSQLSKQAQGLEAVWSQ